jgi:hypothetical protein
MQATECRTDIDPYAADFAPVRDLMGELPRRPSPALVCRWVLRGVHGEKLRTIRIGKARYSTRTEVCRFLNAIAANN